MTLITLPEKLTGAPYLRKNQTIFKGAIDTKILEIYPIDRKFHKIPGDVVVVFNEAVRDVTITNLLDDTVIDLAFVSFYEDERVVNDYYRDKVIFPATIKDKIYVLTWKYYFTSEHWVIFKLNYTDLDGNALEYEFTVYNETPNTPNSYILSREDQPT